MTHLGTYNTHYGQKKGWELNFQLDSQPLKVNNHPNLLAFRWCATYHWKDLDKGYNFALYLISIRGLKKRLWAFKFIGLLISRQNDIWVQALWPCTKYTIRGKVVVPPSLGCGFPQVWVVVNLVNSCMAMVHPCTNSATTH